MEPLKTDKDFVGVGVEWTEPLQNDILANLGRVSCFELIPENFFAGRRAGWLAKLGKTGIPTMIHGVELSLGSDEPLKEKHLDEMLRVADQVNMVNFSDHLCMTESGGVEIGQLTPIPWNYKTADVLCRKIEQVKKRLNVPFLIENIALRFMVPDSELSETDFINLVLRRTDSYLLLDLHNIHANGLNFGFDPFAWLDGIDLERVLAVHLAGGYVDNEGTLVDSHSAKAPPRVWELYQYLCQKITPACTIVEWTDDTPVYETLQAEVDHARRILAEASFEYPSPLYSGATDSMRGAL